MTKNYLYILLFPALLVNGSAFAQKKAKPDPLKAEVIKSVDTRFDVLTDLSDKIWAFEEIAFQETQSAAALADYAEQLGFKVTRGVAEIPTAFVAEYGSGSPIIGILGEFDALPGLSQNKVPTKSPLNDNAPGHGCGHNLFGVASLGAAAAIKDLIAEGKLKGTVRFYGTPAEEKFFGKLWMIRAGLFDDVDVVMDWHPAAETKAAVQKGLALVDFQVEFFGQAAHASADPWNGRSASDALELYTNGINYYREHIKPTVRIHYHIQDAGQVVNVVPDYSRIWVRVRDSSRDGLEPVWKQVEKMASGAAILANVDYKVSLISGIHEVLVNRTGSYALQKNLEALGPISYTEDEQVFSKKIQESTDKPQIGLVSIIEPMEETDEHSMGGSTDVGDVSYVVPTIRLSATTAPNGTPWHSWAVVAAGGMSIGHKGMGYAAKALSMTMVDLFQNPELVNQIKAEFKESKGDYVYKGIIPDGPPPIHSNLQ
ncbi:aminobenzoyl-glutamate utilization protein B [Algoriphagus ratkowskyi]|uniref:Amidohydrolase n=1 Tax=Algoriphagus ratkowskyi TaxID=57028 RepID=A0A2W7R9V8_9BACT|nr:amidohydrolase [Algoriphagus ratkowskyi]PZX56851.1 aminobenzoyl-glutamate utilization protein B [Algoriphagus ratkowskyi]TXD79766.1 amidohydrolase [Algoriphagus ratkowskyi]